MSRDATPPRDIARLLKRARSDGAHGALGRVFGVVRESWPLDADPRHTRPETEVLVSRRSASEAADLAREAAAGYAQSGFHKPSAAWWGSDGESFYRFRVGAQRQQTALLLAGVGLAGLAALAFGLSRKRDRL